MPANTDYMQPIIRGIQAVGSVQLKYRYNYKDTDNKYYLPFPDSMKLGQGTSDKGIDCSSFIEVAGFRLDSEFLRANPQIASSFVIPILGGGGVALTNNNRTGQLNLVCPKVATPTVKKNEKAPNSLGSIYTPDGSSTIGIRRGTQNATTAYYDMVTLAQLQQGQTGGDSYGATILIGFYFCGELTVLRFSGVTVATVDPIGLAGNDTVNYNVVLNYLDWDVNYTLTSVTDWTK